MGFGSIFVQVIFFFIVMTAILGFFSVSKTMALQTKQNINLREDRALNVLQSSVQITNLSYDLFKTNITFIVNNTGKIMLRTEQLDIYVDGVRIPRNQTNRTITILPPDFVNPILWDPDESIAVEVAQPLLSGTHTITVITEYSTKDTTILTV
jgi:archaellum component FlaF (FlaF/FlaG flagellin family)